MLNNVERETKAKRIININKIEYPCFTQKEHDCLLGVWYGRVIYEGVTVVTVQISILDEKKSVSFDGEISINKILETKEEILAYINDMFNE